MDISSLIPQLFYDIIARIIPGTTLLASALILFEGPEKALWHLATWSDSTEANIPIALIILGNLLAAHIIGSLLGGIWFFLSHVGFKKEEQKGIGKYFKAFTKREQEIIETRVDKIFDQKHPRFHDVSKLPETTNKIAYMYDYVLLNCPKAGARIAKLRAELHMSGVLMIGFTILLLANIFFPRKWREDWLSFIGVELLLILAIISAGSLAWHLVKRCNSALLNLSLLASSGEK